MYKRQDLHGSVPGQFAGLESEAPRLGCGLDLLEHCLAIHEFSLARTCRTSQARTSSIREGFQLTANTLDQLDQIPALAAEVLLTTGAKNPSGHAPIRGHRQDAPPAPADQPRGTVT